MSYVHTFSHIAIIIFYLVNVSAVAPSSTIVPFGRRNPSTSIFSNRKHPLVRQSSNDTFINTPEVIYDGPSLRKVLLINGTTDDSFMLVFSARINVSMTEYRISVKSNDSEILVPETDVNLSYGITPFGMNTTVDLDFSRFVGSVSLTFDAISITDNVIVDSISIEVLVAGLVIFQETTRTVVSGSSRSLIIESYMDVYENRYRDLGVQVQYLNGSNYIQSLDSNDELIVRTSLADVQTSLINTVGQVLWDQSTCTILQQDQEASPVALEPGCGIGFGLIRNDTTRSLKFALMFEQDRGGEFQIFFQWPEFTIETLFDDEEMTTLLNIRIGGQLPAVVRRIEPGNPFDRNGGEELYIETINAIDVNITSFNVLDKEFKIIKGSRTFINGPDDFYQTAKFLTEPGTGHNLAWTLTGYRINGTDGNVTNEAVTFLDRTGFLFSYDDQDIELTDLEPRFVPEGGDVEGTLFGNFTTFDIGNSEHNIFIGNNKLSEFRYISVSSTELRFLFPPRYGIGAAWDYKIFVQIDNSYSNSLLFSYWRSSYVVQSQAFGASFENGIYKISSCGNTTFVISSNAGENETISYKWSLHDDGGINILEDPINATSSTDMSEIEIQNEMLMSHDIVYTLLGQVKIGNVTSSQTFLVQRSRDVVVGVTIIQPENRTISTPNVNMRIVAKVETPGCWPNASRLLYEWEYENKKETIENTSRMTNANVSPYNESLEPRFRKYIFSYANKTGTQDGEITPTRLGRELIVPMEELDYGLHRIRLTVKADDEQGLFGVAQTTVGIFAASLVSRIGTGSVYRKVSDAENMEMSGAESFDPDVLGSGDKTKGLSYEWTCLFSVYSNISDVSSCDEKLMPPEAKYEKTFNISTSSLQEKTALSLDEVDGQVYVQYILKVKKQDRESTSTQLIAITRSDGRELASIHSVSVLNSNGKPIDRYHVDFWEDVIIRPSTPSNVQWRFRLDLPVDERSLFFADNAKIITNPGYYTTTGSSSPSYQRLPLGIRADMLKPHEEYQFTVSFQETGKINNEVKIRLKTVEVPSLIFPPLSKSNGTIRTMFHSIAHTSFSGNSSFAFQFYLMEINGSTREYCVDGCTGANTVRFQVAKAGRYHLQCRLYAANGKKILSIQNNTEVITIAPSDKITNEQFDNEFDKDYFLGDDGAINQRGFFVAQSIYEQDELVVSLSNEAADEACANYTKKWAKLSRTIIQNELPNTANARNYVSLAANYARLRCVEDEETMYDLLAIVDQSISRTPPEETLSSDIYSGVSEVLTVDMEEELRRFYNYSIARAASNAAGGSTHRKLGTGSSEVDNLVIDLSELWMQHLSIVATQDRVCGWEATFTSGMIDGEPGDAMLVHGTDTSASISLNAIKVAVRCNPEQGTSLQLPHSSFSWCDEVYEMGGSERKLITLAESFDYSYFSGVQGNNQSDSERLVTVDITTISENNTLVSAIPASSIPTQTGKVGNDVKNCYRIGLSMADEAMQRTDKCSENIVYTMWPRKPYGKMLDQAFEDNSYRRRTEGIRVINETRNSSNFVIAESDIVGLYGVQRTQCENKLIGTYTLEGRMFSLLALLIAVLLVILIITLAIYLIAKKQSDQEEYEDDFDFDGFVERDAFGRREIRLIMDGAAGSASVMDTQAYASASSIEPLQRSHLTLQNLQMPPKKEVDTSLLQPPK